MKKRGLLFFIFALLLLGCVNKEKTTLNEFQVTACEAAFEYNTCPKLNDLGLVSNSECCAMLDKCCNFKATGYALSDLEIIMCDAAQEGGICDRLTELGIVTQEECCSEQGKCCTTTLTCSQAGGSCKDNTCDFYSDCITISGGCTSGYCCSGSCATTIEICSSDIECAQCGNTCIPKTQWNSSCAPPTISFDCKCVSNSCVIILKKTEKTMLLDCMITCVNQNGCICPLGCQNVGETTYGMNCGGKKIPSVEEVSLCEGCLIDDRTCLEVRTQKQEFENGAMVYCSTDKKLEKAKMVGESCDYDYECLTYICKEGLCFEEQKEEAEGRSSQIILIAVAIIIFAGLLLLVFKLLSAKKTAAKIDKKSEKEDFILQKYKQRKYEYKYRPEFDILEKKLKEALGKQKK